MSELNLPTPEPLATPEDALATVRGRARTRRWRRLAVGGSAGLALVVVIALAVRPPSGSDSVGFVSADSPTPRQPGVTALPVPSLPIPSPPGASLLPSPLSSASGRPVPRQSRKPPRQTPAPQDRPPIIRATSSPWVTGACAHSPDEWCAEARVVDGDGQGEQSTFQLAICRAAASATGTLHYGDAQEADFVVRRGGDVVWTWSHGLSFIQTVHAIDVSAGSCSVWTLDWDQRDDSGHLVDPGAYELTATTTAGEFHDQPTRTPACAFSVGEPQPTSCPPL